MDLRGDNGDYNLIIESAMYCEINTSELSECVGAGHSYQGMNSLHV